VLGDLAQATAPGAQSSWDDVVRTLGSPPGAAVEELALGYRVPASIMDFANGLLPSVAPGVRAAGSVRAGGRDPELVPVDASGLAAEAAARVAAQAGEWATVGVVVPGPLADEVAAALAAAGVGFGTAGRLGRDSVVTLLAPPEAKGLEFDAVVVVEPAAFLGDGPSGGRLLYIALTRAVQALTVVHADPLPAALAA
jgi:DNA helicase IV